MKRFRLLAGLTAGVLALSGAARAAVTDDNFVDRTTGDLATLCSAGPTDRLYTAAVNFCEGFGVGAYGVLAAAQQANPKLRLFCVPAETTRNEAIAAFVVWAGAKPERAALSAVDGVVAFLHETYPCPKEAGAAAPRRAK